ncbi:MAG: cytidine deaminase [Actinomycetota bacterium]|nr:cytidine deaminase [Actinomycetota bacterium]
MDELNPEDAKLVTLARGARARIGASQGAAVRDELGRTYAGATVELPSLHLSSLELAVAQAVAAGATGLECAVVVGGSEIEHTSVRDLGGSGVTILICAANGSVQSRIAS